MRFRYKLHLLIWIAFCSWQAYRRVPVLSTVNSKYNRTKVLKPVQKFTNPMKTRKPLDPQTGSTTLANTSTPMTLNRSCNQHIC